MKRLLPVILSQLLIAAHVAEVSAWDSVGTLTHRQLTADAMLLVSANDYPDIAKFSAHLIEYSANESTQRAAAVPSATVTALPAVSSSWTGARKKTQAKSGKIEPMVKSLKKGKVK